MRDYTKLFNNDLITVISHGDKDGIEELRKRVSILESELNEYKKIYSDTESFIRDDDWNGLMDYYDVSDTITLKYEDVHVGDGYFTSFFIEELTTEEKEEVFNKGSITISKLRYELH